jgi:hypothetical protein
MGDENGNGARAQPVLYRKGQISNILAGISKRRNMVLESMAMMRLDSWECRVAMSKWFNVFMYILVIFNSLEIGFRLDHDEAITLPIDGDSRTNANETLLAVIENTLCALFTIEIMIRMAAYRRSIYFFKDPIYRSWNTLDFSLLIIMIVDTWIISYTHHDETLAIRILRLTRMLRLVRILKLSDDLRILFRAMWASSKSILISGVPLIALNYTVSAMLTDWCNTPGEASTEDFKEYFGSMRESMLTLWQLSQFDEWYGILHSLISEAPFWGFLLLAYMLISSFMVLNVLLGVISQIIFTNSSFVRQEFVQSELEDLYDKLEALGKGKIHAQKVIDSYGDRLGRLGVKVDLLPSLFAMLDPDGTGDITREAFVMFMLKVTKDPESQDIIIALKTTEAIRGLLHRKKLAVVRRIIKSNPDNLRELGSTADILLRDDVHLYSRKR